jgi:hypothetical protein
MWPQCLPQHVHRLLTAITMIPGIVSDVCIFTSLLSLPWLTIYRMRPMVKQRWCAETPVNTKRWSECLSERRRAWKGPRDNQPKQTNTQKNDTTMIDKGCSMSGIDDKGAQTQRKQSDDGPTASNNRRNNMWKSGSTYDVARRYAKYRESRKCRAKHGRRRMKVCRTYTTSRESKKTWDER